MSLTAIMAEDRRLVVLRTLSEIPGSALNENVLRTALQSIGHSETTKDLLRADLQYLSDHGLLRIETIPVESGVLWIAHLTAAGNDVAEGHARHPGVARRTPGD